MINLTMTPFNKPYLTGKEAHYMYEAVYTGKLSGNGAFTKKCHNYFEQRYGFGKCLLTTSCTDALEMAAILCNIEPGDEVIVPSYTFVSTANDERFYGRAEIIWEKGTNRAEFFRGEVNKYGWVDTGSSFLPSEVIAAFLYAQLENLDEIQSKRKKIWQRYHDGLAQQPNQIFQLLTLPDFATNNAHMFYIVCRSLSDRAKLIQHLKENGVWAVFHYLSLHSSDYYQDKHDGRELPNCDKFADCLLRLPMYYELTEQEIEKTIDAIKGYAQ